MARAKKTSSDSPQTRAKRRTAEKPIAETKARKRVVRNTKSSVEKVEIESAKQQSKQTISGKSKNQLQEASTKMKSKQSSGEKASKAKVRKLRAVSSSPPPANLEEEIRVRAYEISLESPDDPVANWLKAEAEIKAKYKIAVNQ
jgi:hypothetical protein